MKPFLCRSAGVSLSSLAARPSAQAYPSKPITFIIPFAAGGDSDLSGRNVAQYAPKYLNNQPIVALNRVGASGVIGAMAVRTAPADGYTLLVARIATHAIVPALDSKVPYKWDEFTMLSLIELNPYICFVKGDSPHRTAAASDDGDPREPRQAQLLDRRGRHQPEHGGAVPDDARGSDEGPRGRHPLQGRRRGHDRGARRAGPVRLQQRAHRDPARQVGSAARAVRHADAPAELPDVPSAREAGFPDMEKIVGWTALMGPPGLPRGRGRSLGRRVRQLAKDPDWQTGNAKLGGIAAIRSPADTEKFVREQYELYEKLVGSLGIRQ